MEKRLYPAVFHKDGNGYWVDFPDLPGCLTGGDTFEEAFKMAGDALFCWLENTPNVSEPTVIEDIQSKGLDIIQMVQPIPYLSADAKQNAISEAIENGLKERKLNKNQVATILGVDRSYITYIAQGGRVPSIEMAQRIGLLLDFDWRIFFPSVNTAN